MIKKRPLISLIVCVRNGIKFLHPCLKSILSQKYTNFEVICIEGGGPKEDIKILESYSKKDKRFRIFKRVIKQPEGVGNKKWIGYNKAKGDIVGIIDIDNILQKDTLFDEVVSIFNSKKDVTGVLAGLKHDKYDKPLVRFVSLFGGDPFFSYRSIDFLRNINDSIIIEENEIYQRIKMSPNHIYLTGGNVFFYDKKTLESVGGYDQDVMTIERIVKKNKDNLFVVKNATKHYAAKGLLNLSKKMMVQKDRSFYEKSKDERFNYLPQNEIERREFMKNILFNFLIIPNFLYSIKLFKKFRDKVSFSYPFLAFLTSVFHAYNYATK